MSFIKVHLKSCYWNLKKAAFPLPSLGDSGKMTIHSTRGLARCRVYTNSIRLLYCNIIAAAKDTTSLQGPAQMSRSIAILALSSPVHIWYRLPSHSYSGVGYYILVVFLLGLRACIQSPALCTIVDCYTALSSHIELQELRCWCLHQLCLWLPPSLPSLVFVPQ